MDKEVDNVFFDCNGVHFEVTTCSKPPEKGRQAGFVFNFGLAILDQDNCPIVHINNLSLMTNDKMPGGFKIVSPRKTWKTKSGKDNGINAAYFYAGRDDDEQNERHEKFLAALIPALKEQLRTNPTRAAARGVGDDWYNQED